MKLKNNIFKKGDIVIIVSLLLLSFVPEIIFGSLLTKNYTNTYAEITVDGKFYKSIPLSSHSGIDELLIETDSGYNHIVIEDDHIGIDDASCEDKLCIEQGFISKPGQTVVCLPNKVVIEVKGTAPIDDDDIILSH